MVGVLGAKYCSTLAAQYSVLPFLAKEKTSSPGISNNGSQGGGDHRSMGYIRNGLGLVKIGGCQTRRFLHIIH